jgi:hypothetical protein
MIILSPSNFIWKVMIFFMKQSCLNFQIWLLMWSTSLDTFIPKQLLLTILTTRFCCRLPRIRCPITMIESTMKLILSVQNSVPYFHMSADHSNILFKWPMGVNENVSRFQLSILVSKLLVTMYTKFHLDKKPKSSIPHKFHNMP